MKVATWNVNSLTARYARVEAWLTSRESRRRPHPRDQTERRRNSPRRSSPTLGYESAHYGQGQWNGVAILSRVGIEDVVRGFGDDDPEARVIAATCAGVRVVSCYVPNGRALDNPHYVYKLQWLEKLRDLVARARPRSIHRRRRAIST